MQVFVTGGTGHSRDLAALFRLALEKGSAGKSWHGIEGAGNSFATGTTLTVNAD